MTDQVITLTPDELRDHLDEQTERLTTFVNSDGEAMREFLMRAIAIAFRDLAKSIPTRIETTSKSPVADYAAAMTIRRITEAIEAAAQDFEAKADHFANTE